VRKVAATVITLSALFAPLLAAAPATATDSTLPPQLAGVPDYDIDPLLLKALTAQLSAADKAVAAADHRISAERALVTSATHRVAISDASAARAGLAARAAQARLVYAVRTGYMEQQPATSPALQIWAAPDAAAAAAMISNADLLNRVLVAQARQDNTAAAQATQAEAQATAARAKATAARRLLDGLLRNGAQARATAVVLRARLVARIRQLRATLASRRLDEQHRAAGFILPWSAYTQQLAQLPAPPAAALRDPAHLPAGELPVRDAAGNPQPGAAQITTTNGPLLVLPREVITAISYAIAHLGAPYVWGSAGPRTFDCSGLVQAAYRSAGLDLPRVAAAQHAWAPAVPYGDELPGDLVFFIGADGTASSPGHVGMVIDPVRHLMIQAPQSGDVVKISDYTGWGGLIGFGRPSLGG
jgi:hypothetical protein